MLFRSRVGLGGLGIIEALEELGQLVREGHFAGVGDGAAGLCLERGGPAVPELRHAHARVQDGRRVDGTLLPVVADPSGTPVTKKSTIQKLIDLILGAARTFSSTLTATEFIASSVGYRQGTRKFNAPVSMDVSTSGADDFAFVAIDSNGANGGRFLYGWSGANSNEKYWAVGALSQGFYIQAINDNGSVKKTVARLLDSGLEFRDYGSGTRSMTWQTDGNGNIGASGANRPDNVYVKTLVRTGRLSVTAPSVPEIGRAHV